MGLLRRGMAAGFRGKWKIMRGDRVQITAGKDKGQVGTVMKVIRDPDYPRVIVEGLNLVSCRRCRLLRGQCLPLVARAGGWLAG